LPRKDDENDEDDDEDEDEKSSEDDEYDEDEFLSVSIIYLLALCQLSYIRFLWVKLRWLVLPHEFQSIKK
jgi:hypothetical protein